MLESFKITAELIGMDTWKHKLKNNRYIDISHYKYVNILKQKWEKVFSFPCGFPADKRQNFKISKAFSKGQFIGSGSRKNEIFLFYLLLQCPDSNLRAHRDPSMASMLSPARSVRG